MPQLRVGDIVIMGDEPDLRRCHWKSAQVVRTYPSEDGIVRKVDLFTGTNTLLRPIHKLVFICRPEERPEEAGSIPVGVPTD